MAKLKILREGETDIASADIWRFAVHSDYPTQKIRANGSVSVTILAGNQGIEGQVVGDPPIAKAIPHGLGYVPKCRVSIPRTSTSFAGTRLFRASGGNVFFNETDVLARYYAVTADATNLYIWIFNTVDVQPADRSWTVDYIIEYDQAQ